MGNREFVQFLSVAKGSIGEIKSQHYVAAGQTYINESIFHDFYSLADKTGLKIAGLISYLRGSKIKGIKFR